MLLPQIQAKLKNTKEQQLVVGPLVQYLNELGWQLEQMVFGKQEWYVPKTPSEASKREKSNKFSGFPCDIAIFDTVGYAGNARHLIIIIECKQPSEQVGIQQLETYLSNEPYAKLGIWVNNASPTAPAVFIYKQPSGGFITKRKYVGDIPRPHEKIGPKAEKLTFNDMLAPSSESLKKRLEDLIDKVVARDSKVTRREEQLDQLCNLLLLKLHSDKQAKINSTAPPFFRPLESAHKTAEEVKRQYAKFVPLYPEVFAQAKDKEIRFDDETINAFVEDFSRLRLIDLGVSTVSLSFQVLRSAALKQGEGQYFTPQPVIEAGIKLLQIDLDDIVIDPACGTGGFLVESILHLERKYPNIGSELSRWAQKHVYGIEKDTIGVKLTKAIMQVLGDGSANCVLGDAIRTHNWARDYRHLLDGKFDNDRFTVVVTNPPFGQNLKVSAEDARLAGLNIASTATGHYQDLEIGLLFLNRAYNLLRKGGRVGIVLPETYFFSPNYQFLFSWMEKRLKPRIVANIPMEAFQGFCRAKTNFYIFEKIG